MAVRLVLKCNKCDFSTEIFYRWRQESMIEGEGPGAFFCIKCKKIVPIFIERPPSLSIPAFIRNFLLLFKRDNKLVCPDCGGDKLIGLNTDKCPMCIEGLVAEDKKHKVWY